MIQYNFFINDVAVTEPIGWADITLNIARDEQWHGIFFEASTTTFGFIQEGALILKELKESLGLAATASLRIEAVCGETIDVLEGSFDFGTYIEDCGTTCIVNISVEKSGCVMAMRNRYDQKVDLSNGLAFDKMTQLIDYPGLNFEMTLAGQDTDARIEGYVAAEGYEVAETLGDLSPFTGNIIQVRPVYDNVIMNSINTGQLVPGAATGLGVVDDFDITPPTLISPQILFEDNLACYPGEFQVDFRLKGIFTAHSDRDDYRLDLSVVIAAMNGEGDLPYSIGVGCDQEDLENEENIVAYERLYCDGSDNPTDITVPFDFTYSTTRSFVEGDALYAYLAMFVGRADELPDNFAYTITFDSDTFARIVAVKSCPTTESVVSLINETGSRIVESITDGCLRMKSDYYGRTDSLPYASDEDGCGSLRVLTSGLRLRNADNPVHFMSLRDFFLGLRGIDNIGMGIEPDEADSEWLRVEPVEYFYQNVQVMQIDAVPSAKFILDPKYGFSLIKIGYTKWEVENVNGLDEFNSNKEFRTSVSTVENTLDALSPFIAGGYPIEITRRQSFADSGGADTTYDNDNFIICVKRNVYGYEVEQGNIIDASNFYSPETAYNWRIRPYYNLMRWWKSVAMIYTNFINTTSKLLFSAGTGNLLATGELPLYDPCKLEVDERPENDDLDMSDFAVQNLPIWQPERVTFTYPLSLADYNNLKENPYGYINLQCGSGDYVKAYVLAINYRPAAGSADFNLLLKWAI